ncbi:hypothetical protein CYMTET_34831 [Cymbomonas tetramitiformis]|uniref:Uncharacterized protein n=1 Tax=Cymbomonas tetramitiformis TaxID=36881 RepID=A0AAE0FAA3_9CHLO|nr:hypothetical protein CYMTET_34831 [Cymbomonas tetramitiformis]
MGLGSLFKFPVHNGSGKLPSPVAASASFVVAGTAASASPASKSFVSKDGVRLQTAPAWNKSSVSASVGMKNALDDVDWTTFFGALRAV